MSKVAQALSIAGSDSGGGAGIQADLKTFQERGVFGTTVITAITAQNTTGVFDIHQIPLETIQTQLKAIADDFNIKAFKIGMLGSAEVIKCVSKSIKEYNFGYFVLDPVMISKGGAALLQENAINALKNELIPLCDVITPNLPEVKALTNIDIKDKESAKQAALILQKMGAKVVIIKGGHTNNSTSEICEDIIFTQDDEFTLSSPRFATVQTHGTGCTFSACITAELAKGNSIKQSIFLAKEFISAAISNPLNIGSGHGPTNHWAYSLKKKDD
ncbi:bifunctional hydroxymethylpyrimidine kinase/phosphomethylpyrimidine kinase [Poseidonibacter lekithochrous]|uniref:bifunctional hydroxymethylpyrimidine kinase/phosphomethylpyrimidine kinase n=1 Tax=Poseidonibacter TaxID=2321187 RepID=UPI001C07FCDB|nr:MULTISPECIES: bifunctional hydroxymethylpyrimidine kinase/phosphomethylpyrimidine kinase [Poseidonibacter]MBU3015954.1 bifunctional hydroxymethylpyrimidine kinase/phosphomethylpyrimidine kinase [Poseidonibacter lekithochrous]MDO6829253.1 bifunctional hydroxymethylpyrimidine kinase/phosphomethylpyrimidine kinase [Poseidonibacter sp. 1_MG-2023]